MKKMLTLLCAVLLFASFVYADDYDTGALKKLSRGIANTTTGWLEVFTTIQKSIDKHGYMGGFFYGLPEGATRALLRTAAGIYETLTFPIAIPEGYESIVEPEYVMESPFRESRQQ